MAGADPRRRGPFHERACERIMGTASWANARDERRRGAGMSLSSGIVRAFERALAPQDVISDPVRCRSYECDGLTGYRVVPQLVLLPRSAEQVAAAVRG